MKAIAKVAPGTGVALIDIPVPRAKPGELLVEVKACGICGSDLHFYLWELEAPQIFTSFPRVLGHEPAGVVVEVGEGVHGFQPGDRVACDPHGSCGQCYYCRLGRFALCDQVPAIGVRVDGALAEYVSVPALCTYKVPETLSFTEAAMLEPFGVGVHAIEISSFKPGDEVVVQGPGPIGLLTALALRAAGAGLVVITGLGIDQERLALARQLGFLAVDINHEDVVATVRELTQGRGVDILFDAAGAMSDAAHLLKRGGELIQIGWPSRTLSAAELSQLFFRGITIKPQRVREPSTWARSIHLMASKRVDVDPLVTHRVPLSRGQEAFDLLVKRQGIKILIEPATAS